MSLHSTCNLPVNSKYPQKTINTSVILGNMLLTNAVNVASDNVAVVDNDYDNVAKPSSAAAATPVTFQYLFCLLLLLYTYLF